jgi:hypothetical protein
MQLAEKISRQWEIPQTPQTNEPMVFYFHDTKISEEVTKTGQEMVRKLEKFFENYKLQRKD